GTRFRGGIPTRLQGGGGRNHRIGAISGGEPRFLGLRAARQGHEPGVHLHLHPGRRAAGGLGQGIRRAGDRFTKTKGLGSGETTAEQALKAMGDAGLGLISAWHYDYKSNAPANVEFVKLFNEMHGRNPDFFSIGGYDGMHAIYEALKKTGGN